MDMFILIVLTILFICGSVYFMDSIDLGVISGMCMILLFMTFFAGWFIYGNIISDHGNNRITIEPKELIFGSDEVIVKYVSYHGHSNEIRSNTYADYMNAKSNNVIVLQTITTNMYGSLREDSAILSTRK